MKDIAYSEILTPATQFLPTKVAQPPRDVIKTFSHTKRVGNYLLGKTLGEGSFAKVKEALHVPTGERVAVKVIDKKRARADSYVRKNLRREGKLLQMVRHPNVVKLLEIMETENSYYLVTELCQGGDFMDYICKKKKLDEGEGKKYVKQIVSAVDYLHRLGILHRDLKIENLLLDSNKDIKIIDFGLSNCIKVSTTSEGTRAQEFCVTQCGSPAYAAPELLSHQKYGPQVDVWSIGVNMFAMLTGSLPFTVEPFNIKALHNKMVMGLMNPIPDHLTNECRDLLRKFLTPDPEKRVTITDAMKHNWLCNGETGGRFERHPCPNKLKTEELDSNLLKHMCHNLGFRMGEIVRFCTGNIPSSANATYQLFLKKLRRYNNDSKTKIGLSSDSRMVEPTRISLIFHELPQKRVSVMPAGLKLLRRRADAGNEGTDGQNGPKGTQDQHDVENGNNQEVTQHITYKYDGTRTPLKEKVIVNTTTDNASNKTSVYKNTNMQRVLCSNPTWLRKTCHKDKKTMSEELSSLNKLLSPRLETNNDIKYSHHNSHQQSDGKSHVIVNMATKRFPLPQTRNVTTDNSPKTNGMSTSVNTNNVNKVNNNVSVNLKPVYNVRRSININATPTTTYLKNAQIHENSMATKRPVSPLRKRTQQVQDTKKIRTVIEVESDMSTAGRLSAVMNSRVSMSRSAQSEDSANITLPEVS